MQALKDLKVLEFTVAGAGSWIGRNLAFCGAEVIRVESLEHPDLVRMYVAPWAREKGIQPELSPWLTEWHAGKRHIGLKLDHPKGAELFKRLAKTCGIVVENFRAGALDKLGLGYNALREVRSDLIMLSLSGYGQTGPEGKYITFGTNIASLSGLSHITGFPGQRDQVMGTYPDWITGLHAAFALMAAVRYRDKTGQGQHIDESMFETMVAGIGHVFLDYFANGREPQKMGNRSSYAAPHGCYRCKGDDRWCVIAVSSDEEWEDLCHLMGRLECLEDRRFATLSARLDNMDELDKVVEDWTSRQEDYEVMHALQKVGIRAGVVQNAEDHLYRDMQLKARGFPEELEHLKKGKVLAVRPALRLSKTECRSGRSGMAVGEDNGHVFGRILQMSRHEIEGYVKEGVIEGPVNYGPAGVE